MENVRDRFQEAPIGNGRTGSPLPLGSIRLAAVCLVLGSIAMGPVSRAAAQETTGTPVAPPSPSALNPPSSGGYLQKDKKVPPSEKLSDWPQLKRDQVSPTPRAPCPGKADCKLVPMSRQDATRRLGHAPPGSDSSQQKQGPAEEPQN